MTTAAKRTEKRMLDKYPGLKLCKRYETAENGVFHVMSGATPTPRYRGTFHVRLKVTRDGDTLWDVGASSLPTMEYALRQVKGEL